MKLARRDRQNQEVAAPSAWGSSHQLSRIRNEINRLFEDPFAFLAPSTSFFEGWTPPVDIYEDKDKYVVKAELPGMRREDIEVSLHGNALSICGERKHEEEKREHDTYRSERYFGRFQRSVTLPATVQANKIEASYKDGVLTVALPKSEEAKPKQISVKA